ncbi:TM0106 family RecB-like putative nuclease [Corynebacterium kutscheri]|nr:TM0106 family RecB-like putative nuclease [Corynebacterium kutscheri]
METEMKLSPKDLVGCRYRMVQRQRWGDIAPTSSALARSIRLAEAQDEVFSLLPTRASRGDTVRFSRIDIGVDTTGDLAHRVADAEAAVFETWEALASGATLITNPMLEVADFRFRVAALVRRGDGNYMPVIVSNHRIARPSSRKEIAMIPTTRLGLGIQHKVAYEIKSHAHDSYTLALAARALAEVGLSAQRGGVIGQDHHRVFILNTDLLQHGLDQALNQPIPTQARRVKECGGCKFWQYCHDELVARDDLSLYLSGDRANTYRDQGINTVQGLIDAQLGTASVLAQAWRDDIAVLRQPDFSRHDIPRFDVEIDIDVEAYLDQGAYLWGTFDGDEYRNFVIWHGLGQEEEAKNFARFWDWLSTQRRQASANGKTVGVFCYSAHGENHWLSFSARRFSQYPGVPSEQEVRDFIQSDSWIDVFALVKRSLVGPGGLGLKVVAPEAGFCWEEQDVDGEESVNLFMQARAGDEHVCHRLLSYNGDDCRATRAVREWLSAGAPGSAKL